MGLLLICSNTSLLSSSPLLSHSLFSIYALPPHIISQSPPPTPLLLPLLIPQLVLQHIMGGLAPLAVPIGVCLPAGLSSLC